MEASYPMLLRRRLGDQLGRDVDVEIIAKRGWTTQDLLEHLPFGNIDYHLITLLIGVNDLYDGIAFDIFQAGLHTLLDRALSYARGHTDLIRVLSIPDYTYTPYAVAEHIDVSAQIDQYNSEVRSQCESRSIPYLDITDISRRGIEDEDLVAKDGLHLSAKAYEMIAERLLASIHRTPTL